MKRFYKTATADQVDGGWQVKLDSRGVKTVAGSPQIVPSETLAKAMAEEWSAQGEKLDAKTLILRDASDHAIDIVAPDRELAITKLLAFAETDTLCYRADPDEPLYHRQIDRWEPLVSRIEASRRIKLERTSGIMHRQQPTETLDRLRAELSQMDDFALSALTAAASLAASLCVGLAAIEDGADAEELWAIANLEEDWQAEQWGWEASAEELRAKRLGNFREAMRFAALSR
ncbi:ATP12 family protein [Altererythrobacter sp. ZODW24]|uniref:ATP12 family chaperone protein n=1 Tax=Altererythrobacter sp. ZODW24 TaxID=2185142 RepID=UPI000DF7E95E|nr:ATP12 family protein [Altererythrobacter sp. ZODW24]